MEHLVFGFFFAAPDSMTNKGVKLIRYDSDMRDDFFFHDWGICGWGYAGWCRESEGMLEV